MGHDKSRKVIEMKNDIKMLMIVFVLFMMFIPSVSATEEDAKEEKQKHEMIELHIHMYYQLLTEKYAPNEVVKWDEIRKERLLIKKKISEARKRGEDVEWQYDNEEWKHTHKQLHEAFYQAVKKYDEDELRRIIPLLIEQEKILNDWYKKQLKTLE